MDLRHDYNSMKGSLPGGMRASSDAEAFAQECHAKGMSDSEIKKAGKARGFTLIELLVVVGIISILAGFILPAVGKAWENGKRSKCINNLKQIGNALHTYALDYGGLDSGGYMPLSSGANDTAAYGIGLRQAPNGLGILVSNNYLTLDIFKPINGKEVNTSKPVTDVMWTSAPGPGKAVETHYLYRRLDEGASAILDENVGKAIVIDLNCNSNPSYDSHRDRFSHILKQDGSVRGFDNIDGSLTVSDGSNTIFYDPVLQSADVKY